MKRVTAAAVALLVAAGLTGCGIPSSTDVQVRGGMPSPEVGGGADTVPGLERTAANSVTARDVVNSFLIAPAGDPEQAAARARSFISPSMADDWKPSGEINIVRLAEEPIITEVESTSFTVGFHVQHLGVLSDNGSVDPPNNEEQEYTLTVGAVTGQTGLWVTNAPPLLLLRDTVLERRYEPTSVYFWNKDHTALVPDLRWLPLSISAERRPTELLEWLSGGPSGLISQSVEALPPNVKQKGNVPKVGSDQALEVNLSAEAGALDEEALNRLGTQLWWTLDEHFSGDLLVKVEGQLRKTFTGDAAMLAANPSSELTSVPDRFAIYDGAIKRLREPSQSLPPVPLVTPETNTGVTVACFARLGSRVFGAWVRNKGQGQGQELVVSAEGNKTPLQAPIGTVAGRPAWLWAPDAVANEDVAKMIGLILIDGKLQQFGTQNTNRTPIAVSGLPGPITSLAVSHDGQRIALVSGGRLFVTVLIRADTTVKVGTAVREVHTSLRGITAVDFASQDEMFVAGQAGNRVGIVQVTLDGAKEQSRVPDLGSAQVTNLAAYPVSPVGTNSPGSEVAFVANNIAYRLFSAPVKIETTQLQDPPADAVSNKITAPFFLE